MHAVNILLKQGFNVMLYIMLQEVLHLVWWYIKVLI